MICENITKKLKIMKNKNLPPLPASRYTARCLPSPHRRPSCRKWSLPSIRPRKTRSPHPVYSVWSKNSIHSKLKYPCAGLTPQGFPARTRRQPMWTRAAFCASVLPRNELLILAVTRGVTKNSLKILSREKASWSHGPTKTKLVTRLSQRSL